MSNLSPDTAKACSQDQQVLSMLTDQLVECIHCGLCLEACPTYVELGREEDSPRGRIYLMRQVAEGKTEIEDSILTHLDRCLGCRACETACPSSVQYGYLLEHTRSHIEKNRKRPLFYSIARRLFLEAFTRTNVMAFLMFMATLPGRITGGRPAAPGGILSRLIGAPTSGTALRLKRFPRLFTERLPEKNHAPQQPTARVAMLEGCVMPVLFDEVNKATMSVLDKLGVEVVVPQEQGCCGALHVHNGFTDAAKEMALKNITVFEQYQVDWIVVNSAGCGSTMKEYPTLFEPDTEDYSRALRFSEKVKDISEVIVTLLPHARFNDKQFAVTYHDACHLAHGQKIRVQPRQMLSAIPGLKLVTLPESDHCCGSAGVYSFTEPEIATTLQKRKVNNILGTGADIVAAGNPGCQMWIRSGLIEAGGDVDALHPIEILDQALLPRDATTPEQT